MPNDKKLFKSKINIGKTNSSVLIPKESLSKIGITDMAHCVVVGNSIQISSRPNMLVPMMSIDDFISH